MDTSSSDDVVFDDAGVGDNIVTDDGHTGSTNRCDGDTTIPSHDNNHFKSMKWMICTLGQHMLLPREDFVEGKMIFHFLLFSSTTKLIPTSVVPWQQLRSCSPLAFSTNIADT